MEAMTLEGVRGQIAAVATSDDYMLQGWIAAIDAHLAQPAQAVDATGRSAKDYAIEHAGYMARGATGLIAAINDLELARQQFDEGDGSEDATNEAEQSLGDAMSAMRALIYEFEKRRDRALCGEKAGPVGDGWQPIETAPKDGTSVLLAFGGKKPVGGWWNDDRYAKVPRPYWSTDNERIVGIPWLRSNPPIAWMPLPASPTPDKEGEG